MTMTYDGRVLAMLLIRAIIDMKWMWEKHAHYQLCTLITKSKTENKYWRSSVYKRLNVSYSSNHTHENNVKHSSDDTIILNNNHINFKYTDFYKRSPLLHRNIGWRRECRPHIQCHSPYSGYRVQSTSDHQPCMMYSWIQGWSLDFHHHPVTRSIWTTTTVLFQSFDYRWLSATYDYFRCWSSTGIRVQVHLWHLICWLRWDVRTVPYKPAHRLVDRY